MSAPEAQVVHEIPGRARVRIPRARGQLAFLQQVERELTACPLVRRVQISAVTGSVLILHEGHLDEVLGFAKERHLLDVPNEPRRESPPLQAISDRFGELDERVRAKSDGRWSVGSVSFYSLVSAAVYQVGQGKILPPAGTLLFQAMTIFLRALESDRKRAV